MVSLFRLEEIFRGETETCFTISFLYKSHFPFFFFLGNLVN
jgi:hypothetical protein